MFQSYVMCNAKRLCELLTTVFFLLRFSLPPSRLFRADVSLCTLNARVTFANALFLYAPYIRITASKHRRVCNCGQHELIELNNTRKTKATPGPEYQQQILFFFFFIFLSFFFSRPSIAANATATVFVAVWAAHSCLISTHFYLPFRNW